MTIGKQLELGFRTYFSAIGFIFSKGLWWAFIFPVILNVLLFIGGYEIISSVTGNIQDWVLDLIGLKENDFFLSEVLTGFLSGVIWLLMKVMFFFVFAYWGGYITLILLSPLFAYLSERTEEIVSGKKYPFNGDQLMRDIVRGILISLRNMFIQTGWMILFFFIGFIPVIGWLGAIVLFIISAYFYGFAFIDYTSERRRMKISQSVQFVRSYKWLAIANGTIFCLFLILPFCGVLFSGFAAIVSVVAATLAVNEVKSPSPTLP
ncbi:MAG: EI24 domain-containing protein [Bacteroidetes bacterium]|nr:EI24 domain-containing protein [Bacteroidota bacterium]